MPDELDGVEAKPQIIQSKKSFLKRFWWVGVIVLVLLGVAWAIMTFVVHSKGNGQTGDNTKKVTQTNDPGTASNIDPNNPPKFIQADFVELDKVYMISKFRSGDGHDFSVGSGETCRSMKHYFSSMDPAQPDFKVLGGMDKSAMPMPTIDKDVKIFAPVDGVLKTVNFDPVAFNQELDIIPDAYPSITIRVMHAQNIPGVKDGHVAAGQAIGLVLANQSFDLAISVDSKGANKNGYISYFAVMPDSIFAKYQARGITSRDEMIISKEYRDTHPFQCVAGTEQFVSNYSSEDQAGNLVFLSGYDAIAAKLNPSKK